MKFRKTAAVILFAVMVMTLAAGNFGCKKTDLTATEFCVMNGYENYSDLEKTLMNDNIFGRATICKDGNYVTEGEGSMKLDLDFNSEFTASGQFACVFKLNVDRYDEKFRWLDNLTDICIDIYNAQGEEYDFYIGVFGDQNKCWLSDGATVAANSWNFITIPLKPWFFEKDTLVREYRFYIDGVTESPSKKATFYVDNIRLGVGAEGVFSPSAVPAQKTGENEILDFDTVSDLDYLLARQSVADGEFLPFVSLKQSPNIKTGEKQGSLKVGFNRTHAWGLVYIEGNGYDVIVHESLLSGIVNPKSVSVICSNPDSLTHGVTLIAQSGGQNYSQKVYVKSGATEKIELNLDGVSSLESLSIRIDSWNLTDSGHLYFAELRYVS